VQPDILVIALPRDMGRGLDTQLEAAVAEALSMI